MKIITSEQLGYILSAAHDNTANVRGCRQRVKAEHAEIMRFLDETHGVDEVDDQYDLSWHYVVYVRTGNLGTKKWPDCYKAAEVSGVIVKETEKMIYTNQGEHIRKEKILAVVV